MDKTENFFDQQKLVEKQLIESSFSIRVFCLRVFPLNSYTKELRARWEKVSNCLIAIENYTTIIKQMKSCHRESIYI